MNFKPNLLSLLNKHFGYSEFRENQLQIIDCVLENKNTLVIMPTGGGKSLCYQLSAIAAEGTAIIISPLIALMKNQVDVLKGLFDADGVANVFNSSLTQTEREIVKKQINDGTTKLLYLAPESLTKQKNIDFLKNQKISFVAVDEAHCISEWGHDFRPDYRKLNQAVNEINPELNIIALTATATPKVQDDIIKNLRLKDVQIYKSSFNRPNLFYEVKHKTDNVNKDVISFIKKNDGKSGIVYCLSRKKVDEITNLLQLNNINALPYHAGYESKVRSTNQEHFLMHRCDVIVATIAFGMGIDKPDIRYVIHYDIPKSLEAYYQETGRAGRDGGEGHCLAFYSYDDIEKLEKFLSAKPVSEREKGLALLEDVASYSETSSNRRKVLLNYFGEDYDEINGKGANMDDNSSNPKQKNEVKDEVLIVLNTIIKNKESLKIKYLSKLIISNGNDITIKDEIFKKLNSENKTRLNLIFWKSLIRNLIVNGYLQKKVEDYGIIKVMEKGNEFLNVPHSYMMPIDKDFNDDGLSKNIKSNSDQVIDKILYKILIDERLKLSIEFNIPPFAVFQESSINEMTYKYPLNYDELSMISGVGEGKSKKFGERIISIISKYCDENNIEREQDFLIKSTGSKSTLKLFIIQSVDKKLSISEIADSKNLSYNDILDEIQTIVFSGTKLDLSYLINDIFDEDSQEELYDFLIETKTDDVQILFDEFNDDFEEDDLKLYRIHFYCKVAF
ncbi:MAG: RecQ family ATP-dependent DNA helicase [Flavobacteriaceae bacterium]